MKNKEAMLLHFIPRTNLDANQFNEAIDQSDWHCEWDVKNGQFTFEEDKDMIDELEVELERIKVKHNINGYFEAE